MRHPLSLLLAVLFGWGCSSASEPEERSISLGVSGLVTVEGSPASARVELWDSRFTDSAGDDIRILSVQSDASGAYILETEVSIANCNGTFIGQHYVTAVISGLVHVESGEPSEWGASENVFCETGRTVDIDIEIPEFLMWPSQ